MSYHRTCNETAGFAFSRKPRIVLRLSADISRRSFRLAFPAKQADNGLEDRHCGSLRSGGAFSTPSFYPCSALPPGVLEELRRLNPVTESGWRKRKHFQHLTADTGNEHLDRQITAVITLMRISDRKEELERNFAKAFGQPVLPIQERLPLTIDSEGKSE
ncbi:MAG: P63C domain-containing protein [Terriglobia bacterium]